MHPNVAPPVRPRPIVHDGSRAGAAVELLRREDRIASRFRVPPSLAGPKVVFLACHYCAYSPAEVPSGGRCPKCGGYSWERYALSTRLLPGVAR